MKIVFANNSEHVAIINRAMDIHPRLYYQAQFPNIPMQRIKTEWISVNCCFHEDHDPSLGLNLTQGYFRCFGCGAHGRSIIGFHSKRYHLSFINAAKTLGNSL